MIDIITGSRGFIGSHLVKYLGDAQRLDHRDIGRQTLYDQCDKFFFLSTYGNMAHHDELGAIYKANILDVQHVLTKIKPRLLVFFSTSSVKLPVQTSYSIAKGCAERMIENFSIPYLIIRPYSVTGVGEQPEHLIPRLIDSCLNGTRIDFVPEPVHDFIDVKDVVDGIMFLVENGMRGTYELGTGVSFANQSVRDIVEAACNAPANVQLRKSIRAYDNQDWCCKEKIKGWTPTRMLHDTIFEMVNHAKSTR